jgi:transcriptional regulator with XRE-family HTH domain
MTEISKNIYKLARENAGLTRENAGGMLHVATRTLAGYEGGEVIPPSDVVCRMCEMYGATWLGYMHLQKSNPVGQKYLPEIDFSSLSISVLRLQKEMADVSQISPDMIEVACDGRIEHKEKSTWQKVTNELKQMAGAAFSVIFSEKEKTAC